MIDLGNSSPMLEIVAATPLLLIGLSLSSLSCCYGKDEGDEVGQAKVTAKKKKKRGPDSSADGKKTKTMDEVLGIEPIIFSDAEEGEVEDQDTEHEAGVQMEQEASLRESIRLEFAQLMEAKQFREAQHLSATAVARGTTVIPPVLRSGSIIRNLEPSFSGSPSKQKIKITREGIQEEIDFWTPSIVCYVLGANPPMSIFDGFVRRVWKEKIDKGLELKYWGEQVLFRIISQIGTPVMLDSFTKAKEKLNYSRIFKEVSLQQEFPEQIEFEDEHGDDISVYVNYEWKPTTCAHCKGVGHSTIDCTKKGGSKAEWVVKKPVVESREKTISDEDGFLLPKKVWKEKTTEHQVSSAVAVANSFGSLQQFTENQQENADGNLEAGVFTRGAISNLEMTESIRALANQEWLEAHPTAEVIFLNESIFDHTPAVLNFHNSVICGRKSFKYFSMWELHPRYAEIIQQQWQIQCKGTLMFRIVSKLKSMKIALKDLNKDHFSDICTQEAIAKAKLDECQSLLQQQPMNEQLHQQENDLRTHYTLVFKSYLSFLQQKAKLNWAKAGDENSTLFHSSI
uniref:DUF4283 domain-containing protein n=1 Tax=Cannabis sativa TaxID=3483 RepID=A0A803P4R7_CANSA